MGDDHTRDAALAGLAHQPHHRLAVDRVQRPGRLVGQQQAPVTDDGTGDGDALPLAAGQLVGKWSARSVSPSRSSAASAGGRAVRAGQPSSSSGSETFSAAVSPASRLKSWKT